MARFGIYNIPDDAKSNQISNDVHTTTSTTTAEPVANIDSVSNSVTTNVSQNTSSMHTSNPNTRKRKYTQSVSYMKYTANEAFHHICNSKISQSGGIHTFASAQQNMLVIQYQYNTNKLYKRGRY